MKFADSAQTMESETAEPSAPVPEPNVKAPKGKEELAVVMPSQETGGPTPDVMVPLTVLSTNAKNDPDMSTEKIKDLTGRLDAAKLKAKPERKNAAKGKAKATAKAKAAIKSKPKKKIQEEEDENLEEEANVKSDDDEAGFVSLQICKLIQTPEQHTSYITLSMNILYDIYLSLFYVGGSFFKDSTHIFPSLALCRWRM